MTKRMILKVILIFALFCTILLAVFEIKETMGVTSYKDDRILLEYIPSGFEMTRNDPTTVDIALVFKKGKKYFIAWKGDIDLNMKVDTENATCKEVSVNGESGTFISKKDVNMLIWSDGEYIFEVAGNLSKRETIKIAKNMS